MNPELAYLDVRLNADKLGKGGERMTDEKLLLEARPSWWNFFWHLVFFWLIIPPIIALWKRQALVLRVYDA